MAATIIAVAAVSALPGAPILSPVVVSVVSSTLVAGGMYLDSYLINEISGDKNRGDRQQDQRQTTRDEGAPYVRAFGSTVRVPGHVIWEQWPRTSIKNENNSGKGLGASASFLTYTYKQDIAIEWCKCWGRPVKRILEIYANGDTVWQLGGINIDYTSTAIRAEITTSKVYAFVLYYYHWHTYTATAAATSSGTDLSKFKAGKTMTVSGYTTNTAFNSTGTGFEVESSGINEDGESWVRVIQSEGTSSVHGNAGSDETAGDSVTLFQGNPAHSLKNFQSMIPYFGTEDQGKDPTMVARESDANTLAYRDRCYSMFNAWNLSNYANISPQNLEALLEVDPDETVKSMVDAICETAGIDDRDTDDLADLPLRGLMLSGRTAGLEALAYVVKAFDLIMRDEGGRLIFEKRTELPTVTLTEDDLAAHPPDEEPPRDVLYEPVNRKKLARTVVLSYRDPVKDYQQATTTGRSQAVNGVLRTETEDMPITLTSDEAQIVADRINWTARANSLKFEGLQLPPSFTGLKAGQRLQFPAHGRTHLILIESVVYGTDGVVEVSGRKEEPQTLVQTASVNDPL